MSEQADPNSYMLIDPSRQIDKLANEVGEIREFLSELSEFLKPIRSMLKVLVTQSNNQWEVETPTSPITVRRQAASKVAENHTGNNEPINKDAYDFFGL